MAPSVEEVVAKIRAAFPAEPIDFTGALTGGMDGGAYFRAVDGKRWTELDREFLSHSNSALSFMSARHIAMVLPLYLTALAVDGAKTSAPGTVMAVLDRASERRFLDLFDALTRPQRETVIDTLAVFAGAHDDQPSNRARAVGERWRQHVETAAS